MIEEILGKKVERTNSFLQEPISICQYYFESNDFLSISAGNLSYEEQKQARQNLGKEIKTDPKINTEHFIVMEKSGYVSDVVLKISDNYFLAIEFFNLKSMHFRKLTSEEVVIAFVANLVNYLQTGKVAKINIDLSATNVDSQPTEDKTSSQQSGGVPLPQDRDLINLFFDLIGQGKASEAVKMLSSQNTGSVEIKKMWQEQFEAMKFVKVLSIESAMEDSWTDKRHEYKVVLNVTMDESSKNAPMPYYGYDQGENNRFIVLVKEGEKWFIDSIGTGS